MSQYIAVFEDHEGGRQYISRDDLPGFLTDDLDEAQRFDNARYAEALAATFASVTVSREGASKPWRPKWIARYFAEEAE